MDKLKVSKRNSWPNSDGIVEVNSLFDKSKLRRLLFKKINSEGIIPVNLLKLKLNEAKEDKVERLDGIEFTKMFRLKSIYWIEECRGEMSLGIEPENKLLLKTILHKFVLFRM